VNNAEFPGASTQTWVPFFLGTALPPASFAAGSGIVALMDSQGYPPSATRMALSRLCADGTLERERHGRTTRYRLSSESSATISTVHDRVAQFGRSVVWSGSWTLVLVSIPDGLRSTRRKMQGQLSYLGFGRLREAVWIAARDGADDVARLAENLQVSEMVDVFLATPAAFTETKDVIQRCWDMGSLVDRYTNFEKRFIPLQRATARRRLAPADCIRWWMRLTFAYEDMVHRDPELPPELLSPALRLLRERVVALYAVIAPDLRVRAGEQVRLLLANG
jgi:phenylacetic acid degradation operon negative regulatory protein